MPSICVAWFSAFPPFATCLARGSHCSHCCHQRFPGSSTRPLAVSVAWHFRSPVSIRFLTCLSGLRPNLLRAVLNDLSKSEVSSLHAKIRWSEETTRIRLPWLSNACKSLRPVIDVSGISRLANVAPC